MTRGMRRQAEVQAAENEFYEKVWYERHLLCHAQAGTTCEPAREAAARILAKYGEPVLRAGYSDFEWGMINGKLSALRWVLGAEWDFLDT